MTEFQRCDCSARNVEKEGSGSEGFSFLNSKTDGTSIGRLHSAGSMNSAVTLSTAADSSFDYSEQDATISGSIISQLVTNGDEKLMPPFLSPGSIHSLHDVDEELGYPARIILDYWKEKERTLQKKRRIHLGCVEQIQRRYAVDWINTLGADLNLQPITIQSALSIFDEVMGSCGFTTRDWKHLAVYSLNVATKYEEAELNMPMVSEIAQVAEIVLTTRSVTQGELRLAEALGWNLSRVTPMHFLDYYMHGDVIFDGDLCRGLCVTKGKVFQYVEKYVKFFVNLSQQDHSFLKYLPSVLAAAVIMATRQVLCITPFWRTELVFLTSYAEEDIIACKEELWGCYVCMFPDHCALRVSEITTDAAVATATVADGPIIGHCTSTVVGANGRKINTAKFLKIEA